MTKEMLDRIELAKKRVAIRNAYRTPCWEYLPEDGQGGLSRVDWLGALLSDVNSWLSQYPQILAEHADSSALLECIQEVTTLHAGLHAATRQDSAEFVP